MTGASASLSTSAKLVRLVFANQGPLSPREVAAEAHLDEDEARAAIDELADAGVVDCVCGVCSTREEVYALADAPDREA